MKTGRREQQFTVPSTLGPTINGTEINSFWAHMPEWRNAAGLHLPVRIGDVARYVQRRTDYKRRRLVYFVQTMIAHVHWVEQRVYPVERHVRASR